MQRFVPLLTIVAIVAIGCSDDSSTEPDPPDETPLAEETIGSSGGTLETEDFVLTVPPGAFSSSVPLKLYESSEGNRLGNEAVSRDFRLEGLPEVFSDSVSIQIEYSGALNGLSFVAIASEEQVLKDRLEFVQEDVYDYLPARESGGVLIAKLPSPDSSLPFAGVWPESKSKKITAASGYDSSSSAHVKIIYPIRFAPFVDRLLGTYESAYDLTVELGIGFEGKTWDWPARVTMADYRDGSLGGFSPREDSPPHITVAQDAVNDSRLPEFGPVNIVGMFATGMSIPRPNDLTDFDKAWWHSAVILWAVMDHGGPAAPSKPGDFAGHETGVLSGLPHAQSDPQSLLHRGKSWSALVDYLTERDGTEIMPGIYQQIKSGTDPLTALLTRIPGTEYQWWPDFVHRYLTGGYYEIDSSIFLSRIETGNTFRIQSKADSVEIFPAHYEQLSAVPHRITLEYSQIHEDASLKLDLDPGGLEPEWVSLKVYQAKDGVLTFLSEGNPVTVAGIKDLTLSGHDIIPVVINSYTNDPYSERPRFELTARIIEPVGGYTKCSVEAWLVGTFREGSNEPYDELWLPSFHAVGTMTASTFTGTFDPDLMPPGFTGTVTVTLDPVTKALLSYDCTGNSSGSAGSGSWSLSGSGVPKLMEDPGRLLQYFEDEGETCNYVSNTTYVWTPNSGDGKTLVEYTCVDNSEIEITFRP